jgi:endo-1,4-beta-xylanase
MLESIFISILNMSLTAAVTAALIFIIRLFFNKKLPKMFSFVLWALVLIRLFLPFSVTLAVSIFNIFPSADTVRAIEGHQNLSAIKYIPDKMDIKNKSIERISDTTSTVNASLPDTTANSPVKPMKTIQWIASFIWLSGAAILLVMFTGLYIKTSVKLKTSIIYKNQDLINQIEFRLKLKRKIKLFTSDKISTPIVFGILRPKVILPLSLIRDNREKELLHIITHEFYHIKRYDYLSKVIWFMALCIHWFNPLIWLSFILFQKDMEMSCDEKVLAVWEYDIRGEYANSLINLAVRQNMLLNGGLIAFGESNIKSRIDGIVKYKKSGFGKIAACIFFILALGAVLLTNGRGNVFGDSDGKFVGNIIGGSVPSDFGSYWNQVTPENAGKWGSVEKGRDRMFWSNADMIYNYAKSSGIPFKFHTLIWGSQEPIWIDRLSAADQKAEVLEWMDEAALKFESADFVDVVNEPLHTIPSFMNSIGGAGSTGWDWVVWSFQEARKRFKGKLLINEYGIISDPYAAADFIKIINILKEKNLVDGIGIECHEFEMNTVSASEITSTLNTLSATGLPIYVSELDMAGDDNTQLSSYKEKFSVLYENPAVKGITLWGYMQGHTWEKDAYLMDSSGSERPALKWLKQYLEGN